MARLTILAAIAATATAAAARAGPLTITPTTVAIEPGRHGAVVEVENGSDSAVDLQFRAYDWQQVDGTDRLTPSDALVVSPAIATVAPHAKQLFRVLQTGAALAPGERERSYRLRVNQLPRADQPAVSVYLEFSLPVFQTQPGAQPRLAWAQGADGLTVTNTGDRRVRLTALALDGPAGRVAVPGAAAAYLLSGARRSFALPAAPAVPAGARLIATGDTGLVDAPPQGLAAR